MRTFLLRLPISGLRCIAVRVYGSAPRPDLGTLATEIAHALIRIKQSNGQTDQQ